MDFFAAHGYPDQNKIVQFAKMGLVPSPVFRRQIEKDLLQSQGWSWSGSGSGAGSQSQHRTRRLSRRLKKDGSSSLHSQAESQSWSSALSKSLPGWSWLFGPAVPPGHVTPQSGPHLMDEEDITLRLSEDDASASCDGSEKEQRGGPEYREEPPATRNMTRRTRGDWEKAGRSPHTDRPDSPRRRFVPSPRHDFRPWRSDFRSKQYDHSRRNVFGSPKRRHSSGDTPRHRHDRWRRQRYEGHRWSSKGKHGGRRDHYRDHRSDRVRPASREPSFEASSAHELASRTRSNERRRSEGSLLRRCRDEESRGSRRPSVSSLRSPRRDARTVGSGTRTVPDVPSSPSKGDTAVVRRGTPKKHPSDSAAPPAVLGCHKDGSGLKERPAEGTPQDPVIASQRPGLSPDTSIVKVEPIDLGALALTSGSPCKTGKPGSSGAAGRTARSPARRSSPRKKEPPENEVPLSPRLRRISSNNTKMLDTTTTTVKSDVDGNSRKLLENKPSRPARRSSLICDLKSLTPQKYDVTETSLPSHLTQSPQTRRSTSLEQTIESRKTSPSKPDVERAKAKHVKQQKQTQSPVKKSLNNELRTSRPKTSPTKCNIPQTSDGPCLKHISQPLKAADNPSRRRKDSVREDKPGEIVSDSGERQMVRRSVEVAMKPAEEEKRPGTPKVLRSGKKVAPSDRQVKPVASELDTHKGSTKESERKIKAVRRIYSEESDKGDQPSHTANSATDDAVQEPVVFLEVLSEPRIHRMLLPSGEGVTANSGDGDGSSRRAEVIPIPSPSNRKRPRSNSASQSPKEVTSSEKKRLRAALHACSPNRSVVKKQLFGETGPDEDHVITAGGEGNDESSRALRRSRRSKRPRLGRLPKRTTSRPEETSRGRKVFVFCPVLGENIERHPVQSRIVEEKWWKWLNPRQMKYLATKMLENPAICLNFCNETDCPGEWDMMWQKWASHLNSLCYCGLTRLNTGLRMTVLEWKRLWLTYKKNLYNVIEGMSEEQRVHNLSMLEILLISENLFNSIKESKGVCLGPSCPRKWCVGSCKSIGPYKG